MRSIINEDAGESSTQSMLRSLDELLDDGVFQLAPDMTLVFASIPFLKMFGFRSLREAQGIPCSELYADDEVLVYLLDKLREEGFVTNQRILCRRYDGVNFWGSVSARKATEGQRHFYAVIIRNVSDQIKTELDLKHKQVQLEKLTMELDRFIYSASHEIRSPVSTLLGIVNLMKHDLKEDGAQQYIQMLREGIDKLDSIVQQLTAHVKNSKNLLYNKSIDFDLLIRDILSDLSQNHSSFGLVSSSYEISGSGVFYCDYDRLRVILYNVIKNSFDYADRRKKQRILSVIIEIKPEKATIEILDNGVGIASKHVDRVFDMFYRATSLTKGSGIGLYTVREMVSGMGGVIRLNSEYGIGTSVRIELPNAKTGKLINRKMLLRASRR